MVFRNPLLHPRHYSRKDGPSYILESRDNPSKVNYTYEHSSQEGHRLSKFPNFPILVKSDSEACFAIDNDIEHTFPCQTCIFRTTVSAATLA